MSKDLARLPSLNGLRAFEVASRHLNFRLAAEELGVTQGAVAQQVRNLEAQLGLHLFHRRSRSLFLTEAGRGYVTNIRKAFDLIAEATDVLRPEPAHLTISVTPTFATKWLIPRLTDFTEAYPLIDLRIVASDRVANFQTDAVDLAVRLGRPPFGPGLTAEHLFDQVLIAVASPAALTRLGEDQATEAGGRGHGLGEETRKEADAAGGVGFQPCAQRFEIGQNRMLRGIGAERSGGGAGVVDLGQCLSHTVAYRIPGRE